MANVLDVARYIINYSNEKCYGVSNLRLQKLLYFVQAYYLAFTEKHEPCFDAAIEAWDFGPVVPEVYREFKRYGSGNIPSVESYLAFPENEMWAVKRVKFNPDVICQDDRERINNIVDGFSGFSTTALVEITHNQTPWKKARSAKGKIITVDSMKEYFVKQ